MLHFTQLAAFALAIATVVHGQYQNVVIDMQNSAKTGQLIYQQCQNFTGQCNSFFPQNDLLYQLVHQIETGIKDVGLSTGYTTQQAANLASLCNNDNYNAVKSWGSCFAEKVKLYINIGAKTTVCEQVKHVEDLYDSLVAALIANNPNSPSVSAFQNCKSSIDSILNMVRSTFGTPCP